MLLIRRVELEVGIQERCFESGYVIKNKRIFLFYYFFFILEI